MMESLTCHWDAHRVGSLQHCNCDVETRKASPDPSPRRVLHEGVAPKQCQKLAPWISRYQRAADAAYPNTPSAPSLSVAEAMNVWVADRPFSLNAISAWQPGLPAFSHPRMFLQQPTPKHAQTIFDDCLAICSFMTYL